MTEFWFQVAESNPYRNEFLAPFNFSQPKQTALSSFISYPWNHFWCCQKKQRLNQMDRQFDVPFQLFDLFFCSFFGVFCQCKAFYFIASICPFLKTFLITLSIHVHRWRWRYWKIQEVYFAFCCSKIVSW